ncbi:MAG: carboxypeptidase-like regulatory domain-containing protein [Cyclobacteriaceae bacterium]
MKAIYFSILCFISLNAFGQTGSIKGVVKDPKTQEAIIGATVVVEGSSPILGTATGIDGDFIISGVPAGTHSIKISLLVILLK